MLLVADASTFLIAPLFYIKMALVGLAVGNLVLLRRWVFRPGGAAVQQPTARIRMLAATSLVLWIAAMTAGRLTAYLGPAVALAGIN
jgi:hypothetical protein